MNAIDRLAMLPLAAFLVGAAPAEQVIPFPDVSGWSLAVPAGGPVKFRRFGKHGVARFSGRVVLTGTFSYGCDIECEAPVPDARFALEVHPDAESAAFLPRVKDRDGDLAIYIRNGSRVAHAITTQQERAALRAGQLSYVRGRIAIVVDDLEISGECDSVFYSARFVSLTKVQKLATTQPTEEAGC